ncbi:hypothetical protein [Actinokineospora sp. NBRC 105648]|uniref:hypothetical protein n=1 Tax=Actinokineospora sp. NBRC 105648 TaxID=3032206 RepID=UPI0024A18A25|nr:hypothetical protein [Actinokineospora sp. NBRC 105648]GLZ41048.1 hypothetical protein Acsp05_46720 [Actinokineospora sp. NBRC 105648]
MKTVGLAGALCALLVVLTGCGGGPAYTASADQPAPSTASEELAQSGVPPRSGERRPLGNGLTITLSAPKSFVPADSAYPEAVRAIGFEMTVVNNGTSAYRPTLLSLSAMANGAKTQQVIDSTQGYSGVVGAADVPPGRSTRFSVAFAVPEEKAEVQVSAQPDPAGATMVTVFDGLA